MATNKPKPCTKGKRHSWAHQHDVIKQHINGRSVQVSKRGLYACECGANKYGEPSV